MKRLYKLLLSIGSIIVLLLVFSVNSYCQFSLVKADKEFSNFNYSYALQHYKKIADRRGANYELSKKIAESYRLTGNSVEAEKWYAKALEFPDVEVQLYFYYAEALRNNGNYMEARRQFLLYGIKFPEQKEKAEDYALACETAMEWMLNPIQVKVENRKDLNSEYSEFSPVLYKKELLFTTDRKLYGEDYSKKEIYGWTGSPYLFVMSSEYVDSSRSFRIKNKISEIDNFYHNGPAEFTKNGDTMYFTRSSKVRNTKKNSGGNPFINRLEIYSAVLKSGKWQDIKPFMYNNVAEYSVGHAALSPEGNILYFVSDMQGSKGETDIFYCEKQNDGSWSKPVNAGSRINTDGKELFPHITNDGTLYFASNGLMGMGGLDLFSAKGEGKYWKDIANLQYPINSPKDDFGIAVDSTGKAGFFSSNRDGGKGSDDIYHFTNPSCVVAGLTLELMDGIEKPLEDVLISLYKKGDTSEVVAYERSSSEHSKRVCLRSYQPCAIVKDAHGTFYFSLQPGEYEIKASKNGYFTHISSIEANCTGNDTIKLALQLNKIILNKPIVLKDLFYDDKDQLFVKRKIYYDLDKSDIRYDAALELDKLIEVLKNNPNIIVELGSHTDSRHNNDYNIALSQRRAEAAVKYITSKGIALNRITAKGYGEEKLINRCGNDVVCSDELHQQNRRTEIMVTKIIEQETHVVGPYDTIHSISRKYNISVDELRDMNNLQDDIIYAGDILKLKKVK